MHLNIEISLQYRVYVEKVVMFSSFAHFVINGVTEGVLYKNKHKRSFKNKYSILVYLIFVEYSTTRKPNITYHIIQGIQTTSVEIVKTLYFYFFYSYLSQINIQQ